MEKLFGIDVNGLGLGLSLNDCDSEDLSNVIALFVNEDVTKIELFGFDIYFAKVENYVDKSNFGANAPRYLIINNSRGESIVDIEISADVVREIRKSILAQLPIVRESLAKERALLDTCHSKEFGSKAECANCMVRESCKLLFEYNNKQVLNMQGATLNNWSKLGNDDSQYSGEVIDGDGNIYSVWLIFKPEIAFSGIISISDLKFFDAFKVVNGEVLTDNDDALYHCDKLELARFALKGF